MSNFPKCFSVQHYNEKHFQMLQAIWALLTGQTPSIVEKILKWKYAQFFSHTTSVLEAPNQNRLRSWFLSASPSSKRPRGSVLHLCLSCSGLRLLTSEQGRAAAWRLQTSIGTHATRWEISHRTTSHDISITTTLFNRTTQPSLLFGSHGQSLAGFHNVHEELCVVCESSVVCSIR